MGRGFTDEQRKKALESRKAGGKPIGFACMDPERQRQIASMGGVTAHKEGRAHEFTPEEAREAGRLGGLKRAANRRARG
jgi:general stress protein YciG